MKNKKCRGAAVRLALVDLMDGEVQAVTGMIDELVNEAGYPVNRVIRFANRTLHIDLGMIFDTAIKMYGVVPSEKFEVTVQ